MFWKKKAKDQVTVEAIKQELRSLPVDLPGAKAGDLVSAGLLSDFFIKDGSVIFSITVPADQAKAMEPLRRAAEDKVKAMPGVEKVMVALTAERAAGSGPSPAAGRQPVQAPRRPAPHNAGPGGQGAGGNGARKLDIKGVKNIIAVSSAKGGVGKSTSAVNLALALKANGLKVGILDADIYGPSIPRLLDIKGRPSTIPDTKILKPLEGQGIKAMSIGFLVDEDTPMIWRGPMVVSALTQMMRDVAWDCDGPLDVLVVDMPPGTGDIQLTMAQQVPLSGAVIISTPQDLALLDARKGIAMFEKVDIPILGVVENMSYFICPDCGSSHDIFGHGGARQVAEKIKVPFLGEIPLHIDIREGADSGRPIVESEPEGAHAAIYRKIASAMTDGLENARREPPKIIIE